MFTVASVVVSAVVSFGMLILGLVILSMMQRRGWDPVARIASWFDGTPAAATDMPAGGDVVAS